ncbi:hypothetical protein BDQ12DRAFT_690856 [Crucibulum laeve]|uniref:Uncharacterized protein n=1 Tax=Crucibulum laeve TaxID=68775 RepID=A0A5C3LLS8_9AGAR|nr:hypothetical protein BDQ12DRAFT_690856 [Crucibulum laeve]
MVSMKSHPQSAPSSNDFTLYNYPFTFLFHSLFPLSCPPLFRGLGFFISVNSLAIALTSLLHTCPNLLSFKMDPNRYEPSHFWSHKMYY